MEVKPDGTLTRPCVKCRVQEATLDSRSHPVCRDCFTKFITNKCIKQIGLLGKEIRTPPPAARGPPTSSRRYLLGLSLGISSTVLLHLLNENIESQLAKGRNAPFELVVVHIDTAQPARQQLSTAAQAALARYRARYPRCTFHCVSLSSALVEPAEAAQLAASPLPTSPPPPRSPSAEEAPPTPAQPQTSPLQSVLQSVLQTSTTPASRADVLRHLTRRALLAQARARGCQALLLGHSTTALAELTLAEAAKGRGFALPWLIQDGPAPMPPRTPTPHGSGPPQQPLLVYHPLRDALRQELAEFSRLVDPPLTDLLLLSPGSGDRRDVSSQTGAQKAESGELGRQAGTAAAAAKPAGAGGAAVVSHRDLSIEEVMARYFSGVEAGYPSVVANVARTTGKLVRAGGEGHDRGDRHDDHDNDHHDHHNQEHDAGEGDGEGEAVRKGRTSELCGLCGLPLDEAGDERWRGELGLGAGKGTGTGMGSAMGTGIWELGRLCYGCERSTTLG